MIPDINLNSPNKGLGVDHSDSLSDVPVEGAVRNSANLPPGMTEEEAEELRTELTKVQTHMFQNHQLTYSLYCPQTPHTWRRSAVADRLLTLHLLCKYLPNIKQQQMKGPFSARGEEISRRAEA